MSETQTGEARRSADWTISVIVPSFRSWPLIACTVESIYRSTIPIHEILVVDSSDDETRSHLARQFPRLTVLPVAQRCLPGAARNMGARRATGELLAFLDADASAEPGWLGVLVERFAKEGGTGMIGGAVANANPERLASRLLYWIEFSEFCPGGTGGPRRSALFRTVDPGPPSPTRSLAEGDAAPASTRVLERPLPTRE
jgi:glycosyltransferase involved in cell wall biosynthesis